MAKANGPADITQSIFTSLMAKATPADIKSMLEDLAVSKAFDIVEAGAESLSNSEFVSDQFAMGEGTKVISAETVKVGPVEEASGAGAEKMIAQYSPNQVAQHGLTAMATQIGTLVSSHRSMMKSLTVMNTRMELLSAGLIQVLGKSVASAGAGTTAAVVKSEESAGEMRDKEKKKDEEEDGMEKGLLDRAAAEFVVTKSLIVKAEEAEGDGLKGTAKSRRDEAGASFAKAKSLVDAAGALGAKGETIESLAKALEVFAKAKLPDTMQATYPDSRNGETGSSEAMEKALLDIQAKNQEITDAVNGLAVLKSSVQSMMTQVAGQSRNGSAMPDVAALAKANGSSYVARKSQEILERGDDMSDDDLAAARDILGKLVAVEGGVMSQALVKSRISAAAPNVRALFADAA